MKNKAAAALGRLGGRARVKKMTAEQLSDAGRRAALARWARVRRKREDAADRAEMEKRLKEPGPNIPWEEVKKELGI